MVILRHKNNVYYSVIFTLLYFWNTDAQTSTFNIPETNYESIKSTINKDSNEFGLLVSNGLAYFSSRRKINKPFQVIDKKGVNFYAIYTAEIYYKNGTKFFKKNKIIRGNINNESNKIVSYISKDGKTLFYTSNPLKDSSENIIILKATKKGKKWINPSVLSINEKGSSSAHPFLDEKNKYLYFSSDRENGFGDFDIYRAKILGDNSFGTPENLGEFVNSPGKEVSPYITKENELYFSSDGYNGYGKLDVFYVDLNDPSKTIVNLGPAVNSASDDSAFVFTNDSIGNYSTDNQNASTIFEIKEHVKIKDFIDNRSLLVEVNSDKQDSFSKRFFFNEKSDSLVDFEQRILDSIIDLYGNNLSIDIHSEERSLKKNKEHQLQIIQEYIKEKGVALSDYDQPIEELEKVKKEESGLALQKSNASKNYYLGDDNHMILDGNEMSCFKFDFNSSYLNSENKKMLDRIIAHLKANPQYQLIEVSARSDERGGAEYNLWLSDRRVNTVRKYFFKHGITNVRAMSYGESKPLIDCGDDCNKYQHSLNREVTFKIIN